jgi:hypothetical protein
MTSGIQPGSINGRVLELLERMPRKWRISLGVLTSTSTSDQVDNYRTAVTVGAHCAGHDGSHGLGRRRRHHRPGVTSWHDDLTNTTSKLFPHGNQRVKFVDFVNGCSMPWRRQRHTAATSPASSGNGKDSSGEKTGIAPKATLVS